MLQVAHMHRNSQDPEGWTFRHVMALPALPDHQDVDCLSLGVCPAPEVIQDGQELSIGNSAVQPTAHSNVRYVLSHHANSSKRILEAYLHS